MQRQAAAGSDKKFKASCNVNGDELPGLYHAHACNLYCAPAAGLPLPRLCPSATVLQSCRCRPSFRPLPSPCRVDDDACDLGMLDCKGAHDCESLLKSGERRRCCRSGGAQHAQQTPSPEAGRRGTRLKPCQLLDRYIQLAQVSRERAGCCCWSCACSARARAAVQPCLCTSPCLRTICKVIQNVCTGFPSRARALCARDPNSKACTRVLTL